MMSSNQRILPYRRLGRVIFRMGLWNRPKARGGGQSEWALLSFFGRANYNYDNKYLLTATLRRDGTSRISSKLS